MEPERSDREIIIETPHGHYAVRYSPSDNGWVAWTIGYEKIVGHWLPPCTFCDVRSDLNAGINTR